MKYIPLTKELFEAGNEFICKKDESEDYPHIYKQITNRVDKYFMGNKIDPTFNTREIIIKEITKTGFKGWTTAFHKYYDDEFQFSDFLAIVE